jgi:formylglycine-generating enzyme required for sulfatase activity
MVSWSEADQVTRELELLLPTEAQWEWAYRALSRTPFPHGASERSLQGHENLADAHAKAQPSAPQWPYVDWLDDGFTVHAPVASLLPNRFGLHDLGGNVSEWCADTWEDYPAVAPRAGDGLRWGTHQKYRVVRGANYADGVDSARPARRTGQPTSVTAAQVGVRPARALR